MKLVVYTALAVAALCILLTGCDNPPSSEMSAAYMEESTPEETSPAPVPVIPEPAQVVSVALEEPPEETPEPTPEPFIIPEHEIELVAKTLRGECYDEQEDDKREVVRVICNRVSDGSFGDSIEAVITAPHQFVGYRPANEPSDNDYEIAREVLAEWYTGGCQPLSKYLFFSGGSHHKNIFREKY